MLGQRSQVQAYRTDTPTVLGQIQPARRRGYDLRDVGLVQGTKSLSAWIRTPDGQPAAAITLSAIRNRLSHAARPRWRTSSGYCARNRSGDAARGVLKPADPLSDLGHYLREGRSVGIVERTAIFIRLAVERARCTVVESESFVFSDVLVVSLPEALASARRGVGRLRRRRRHAAEAQHDPGAGDGRDRARRWRRVWRPSRTRCAGPCRWSADRS